MPNLILKSARQGDWPAIVALHRRARMDELGFKEGDTVPEALPDLETALPTFDGHIWLALGKDGLLGFVGLRGQEIVWLYVNPDHYRRGVGRTLLRFAMNKCGNGVHASMVAANSAALALYRSLGFTVVSGQTVSVPGLFAPVPSWRLECQDVAVAAT